MEEKLNKVVDGRWQSWDLNTVGTQSIQSYAEAKPFWEGDGVETLVVWWWLWCGYGCGDSGINIVPSCIRAQAGYIACGKWIIILDTLELQNIAILIFQARKQTLERYRICPQSPS